VSVKFCVALGRTPFFAVKTSGNVPVSVGVPLRRKPENVTPSGRAPDSVIVGGGVPVTATGKEPAVPSVQVVLFALVMDGASGGLSGVDILTHPSRLAVATASTENSWRSGKPAPPSRRSCIIEFLLKLIRTGTDKK
jgi:hypothetical protein